MPVPAGMLVLFLGLGYVVSIESIFVFSLSKQWNHTVPSLLITHVNCEHIVISIMPRKVSHYNI